MSKSIETIPADIYHLFEADNDHVCDEANLDAFADQIKQLVRSRLASQRRGTGTLRFSNLGRPDRQLWYAHRHEGEKLSGKTSLKFLYGDLIEQLILLLVKESGHLVEREQEEIEVDGVLGHIDAHH